MPFTWSWSSFGCAPSAPVDLRRSGQSLPEMEWIPLSPDGIAMYQTSSVKALAVGCRKGHRWKKLPLEGMCSDCTEQPPTAQFSKRILWARASFVQNQRLVVEKVGYQAHPLRHLPPRKRAPDTAAAGFFSLFSRVMRVGRSTEPAPGGPEAVSQGRYSPNLSTTRIFMGYYSTSGRHFMARTFCAKERKSNQNQLRGNHRHLSPQ